MATLTVLIYFYILVIGWLISIAYTLLYRLFFSPLASFPGPKLAAATFWYECYFDLWKPAQYVFKIDELHKKYGPVVRINPREISISDPDFLDTIYAPKSGARRDKDFEKAKALGINTSVGGAWQHDLHRKRRESLNPYFSQKSIRKSEPELVAKIDQLRKHFEESRTEGSVVNLSDIYFAFSSDIVSQYCFGYNEDLLNNVKRAAIIRANIATALQAAKFNLHFGWVRDFIRKVPSLIGSFFVHRGINEMLRLRITIRRMVKEILDEGQNVSKTAGKESLSIFHELRDSPSLPKIEKTEQRLEDEAMLMMIAGAESPTKSACIAHYYLLTNPDIMTRLRKELLGMGTPNPSLNQLLQNEYIHAITTEANRLSYGLTGRQPRVSPDAPIAYGNFTIPIGTPVSTSTILVHNNEEIFPNPWTFNPDRWLGPQGRERAKYLLAFSKGPRICIGQNLANAELALMIAEMSRWDVELFETDEDDVKFLHDYHLATPRLDSKGVRVKVLSEHR